MLKDDFMWYLADDEGHKGIGRKRTAGFIFGAFAATRTRLRECLVSNMDAQRVKKPKECEAKKTLDQSCDPDALERDRMPWLKIITMP